MVNKKIQMFNETFDSTIFLTIVKKSLLPALIAIIISIGCGFLYLRYTPPLYTALSILQLTDDKNPNRLLKLDDIYGDDNKNIGKTIAQLRSKEFIKRCITKLSFDVRYFVKGTFLNFELYKTSPFTVEYKIGDNGIYKVPIFIHFYTIDSCKVWYEQNKRVYSYSDVVGNWFTIDKHQFKITLQNFVETGQLDPTEPVNRYFFQISNPIGIENEILENLTIRIFSQQTQTVEICYKSNSAIQAAEVVNVLAETYQKYEVEKKSESTQNIIKYIDNQIDIVYNNLDIAESDMHRFRKKFHINDKISYQAPQPLLLDRNTEMEKEILSSELEQKTLTYIRDELKNNQDINIYELLAMLTGTKNEQFLSNMLNSLQNLMHERSTMLYEVTPNNRRIEKIDTQTILYKRQITEYIESSIERLTDNIKELQQQISNNEKRLVSRVDYNEIEYSKLQRIYSINEGFYHQLIQKKAEYMISQASIVPNSTILEFATIPTQPISPDRTKVFTVTILIAVIFVLIFVAMRYLIYDEVISPDLLKNYTDLPIIGVVPHYSRKVPVSQLLVDKHPNSMFTESFRNIRSNLQFLSQGRGSKIIAVTSTISGEGKTFIAINIAGIQAISGKKVILLDMDLRRPRLHLGFDVDNSKGMSTIICDKHKWQECVMKTELTGLDLITAGPLPPNPAELAFSDKVDMVLEELEDIYDVIIIDTPPIGIVTDALISLNRSNYPIYVFKSGISKRSFINNVNNLAEDKKLSNLSIVFNAHYVRKSNRTTYGYGYYGYEYGYNYYSDEDYKRSFKWLKKIKSFTIK